MTTLIVEDGTKPSGANTYIGADDADTYFSGFGTSDWTELDSPTKAQALVIACKALDLLYGPSYVGYMLPDSHQRLLFPRYAFYDRFYRLRRENVIPDELKQAQCEIALLYTQGTDVFPIVNNTAKIATQSTKIGDISTSVTYRSPSDTEKYPGFWKIDMIMYPILRAPVGTVRMHA